MRTALVLGAGMVGIGAALHLQKRGFSVVVVDRRPPGEETSHGNAGIIQSEAVEPYAMPRDVPSLAKVALGLTNDVHYKLSAMPDHAEPIARYWWNSEAHRHSAISEAYASLIAHAAPEHDLLIREAGAEALIRRDGYLALHRRPAGFEEGIAEARRIGEHYGIPHRILDAPAVRALEPALVGPIAGAVHWTDPWTVSDPGGLVKAYAALFTRNGGTLRIGDALSLKPARSGWSVATADGPIEAEIAVVALGPWSPDVLKPLGYTFSMLRMRGYHRHYVGGATLARSFYDEDWGYVLAPMARGLRITTGAEFTGRDAPATPVQLARAEAAARDLLDLGNSVDPDPWFGERPVLAGMLPMIGAAPNHPGLWFDFGHGHQGFTLGPVSGRLLAEMIAGEAPGVDPQPFHP
ncbi:FAD-binding oxidoreductase [Siculibacillus lacustris]|uniref:FAD-binding oxidoreductase n=1 Tax=Siculibacillus lacustris TaxID=1549641 RepID=A0A4Q9VN42_9HYPH|nr:FAD-binding oxidoreductase [Siculibacillus lacustris]TBW36805.1 FAD-binding oxidoreductase [Siculibacillus lacustris]